MSAFVNPKYVTNPKNVQQVYVDVAATSDTAEPGKGSILQPYQTLQGALTAIALLPVGNYNINLAPGDYGGGPAITWVNQVGKNVSLTGANAAVTSISSDINFTSVALANEQVVFSGFSMSGASTMIFDLALASIATIVITDAGVRISRIDTLAPGPQAIRIFDSLISHFDSASLMIFTNCHWTGGPADNVAATGFVLMTGCLYASMTGVFDGTVQIVASLTIGSSITGIGTVSIDASSVGAAIVGPTVSLLDNATFTGFSPAVPGNWSPVPDDVAEALDQLAASTSLEVPTTFVYRPGGVAGANIYTTWASLYAVLSTVAGPKIVEVDDSIASPASVTAGAYDLSQVVLTASDYGDVLQFDNGATLTALPKAIQNGLAVTTVSAAAIFEVTGIQRMLIDSKATIAGGVSPVPFFHVNAGAELEIILSREAAITAPGNVLGDIDATGNFIVSAFQIAGIAQDTFTGLGTLTINYDDTVFPDPQTTVTVANFLRASYATQEQYDPAVPGDWSPVPDDVAEALDQLAANLGLKSDALYVVSAGNGSDATGNGSWQKPFATIQFAINQAVSDGHGFASQANVLVMPAAVPYAGFTTANGIHVNGLYGDNIGVAVADIIHTPDGSGFATNYVELSGLQVDVGGTDSIAFGPGNPGALVIKNCKLRNTTATFACVFLDNAGSLVTVENVDAVSSGSAFIVDNGSMLINGGGHTALGFEPAVILAAGANFTADDAEFISNGGGVDALSLSGTATFTNCRLVNASGAGASPVVHVLAGTTSLYGCVLYAAGANFNFEVNGGATLLYALITFAGASTATSNAGTVTEVLTYNVTQGKLIGTVSGGQAAAKQIDLPHLANHASVIFTVQGLTGLVDTFDYSLTDAAVTTVDWNALGLDGVLIGGENFQIQYSRKN